MNLLPLLVSSSSPLPSSPPCCCVQVLAVVEKERTNKLKTTNSTTYRVAYAQNDARAPVSDTSHNQPCAALRTPNAQRGHINFLTSHTQKTDTKKTAKKQQRRKKSRSSATRLPRAARSGRATRPCVCDAESTCGVAGVACCVRGADALLTGRAARLRLPPSSATLLRLFCVQQQQQQSQRRTAAGFADAWCSSRAASARAGRRLRCCACAVASLSW